MIFTTLQSGSLCKLTKKKPGIETHTVCSARVMNKIWKYILAMWKSLEQKACCTKRISEWRAYFVVVLRRLSGKGPF